MDNPEIQVIYGTKNRTKTNKTKMATPKIKTTSNTNPNKKKNQNKKTGKTRDVGAFRYKA
jgi:hypothetical protein